jgi:hypothetical protein
VEPSYKVSDIERLTNPGDIEGNEGSKEDSIGKIDRLQKEMKQNRPEGLGENGKENKNESAKKQGLSGKEPRQGQDLVNKKKRNRIQNTKKMEF